MGTNVDNSNNGAAAQGDDTPPVTPQPPTLNQLAMALALRVLVMPPVPGAPTGGTQYAVPVGTDLKTLRKATRSQVTHGAAVLAELVTFASTYDWTSTFGVASPTAEQTQQVFRTAVAWSNEDGTARNWTVQTRNNSHVAWDEVLAVAALLKPVLDQLIVSNPDLTRTMPATLAFLAERSTASKKGAATLAAPATAQAKATKQQTQATHSNTVAQALAASEAILHPAPAPAPSTSGTPTPPAAPASGNGTPTP